jgi:hypothetical protein
MYIWRERRKEKLSAFIQFQAFKGLKSLKKITLDHNRITTIEPFAFKVGDDSPPFLSRDTFPESVLSY